MLTERWAQVEADFQRYYALDLRHEVAGETGCRRLWALIDGLPPDSAVMRDGDLFTNGDHLLANLFDLVSAVTGNEARTPRPGDESQSDTERTAADTMRELMGETP